MRLLNKGLILVGVPLIQAALVIGGLFYFTLQTDHQRLEETRRRKLAELHSTSLMTLYDSGYCLGHILMEHDGSLKQQLRDDIRQLKEQQQQEAELDPSTRNDPETRKVHDFCNEWLDTINNLSTTLRSRTSPLDLIDQLGKINERFTSQSYEIVLQCHKEAAALVDEMQRGAKKDSQLLQTQTSMLIGAVLCSLITAFLLARWFASGITARLQVITDNTLRMGRNEELNPLIGGTDEIASLDAAFHSMAAELKKAIAKERALFETSSDLMCILDEHFCFIDLNAAFSRTLGFQRNDLVGKALLPLVDESERMRTEAVLKSTKLGQPAAEIENIVRHKNGEAVDLLWSVYWSELDATLYAVAHDITELKHVQRQKEQFFHMVSHDLRSPLTSIYGSCQLMCSGIFGTLAPSVSEAIEKALNESNKLIGLINDLLDIGKLEAGKLKLACESVAVSDIIERAVTEVKEQAEDSQISIKASCSVAEFQLDAERMIQACENVLTSAIRSSSAQSTVSIEASLDGMDLVITVCDTGLGLTEDEKERMFNPVAAAAAGENASVGLGLPISKHIVVAHGGQISADSEPGKGRKFSIRIPAQPVPSESTGSAVLPAQQKGSSAERTDGTPAPLAGQRANGPLSFFSNARLFHKGLVLVIVPVAFELIFAMCLFPGLQEASVQKERESHQRLVATAANDLFLDYFALGFSMHVTPPKKCQVAFATAYNDLLAREKMLMSITSPDEEAGKILRKLARRSRRFMLFVENAQNVIAQKGLTQATLDEAFAGQEFQIDYLSRLGPLFQSLIDVANRDGDQYPERLRALRAAEAEMLTAGLVISLLICAGSAVLFSSGILRRLGVMEENVARLASHQPLLAQIRGSDEVANLDKFFHSMAASLEEASRRERAVFDNAQDVVCVFNSDGIIVRANPAIERCWGYGKSEIIGRSFANILSEQSAAQITRVIERVKDSSAPVIWEAVVDKSDGSTCHVRWSLSWNADEKCAVAVAHDISARKELDRLKREFVRLVAEDMRRPLTAIEGVTRSLFDDSSNQLPADAAKQLHVVSRNCERLLTLVDEMVAAQALESGEFDLTIRRVNPSELMRTAADSLSGTAQQKQIEIQCGDSSCHNVDADGDKLTQVLINLLSNALKFSPSNSTIVVSTKELADTLEFNVEDQGRGIPEEKRNAIFEQYGQASAADGARKAGTGLGLTICKQIVEKHGGTIGVDTTESGVGSRFYFRIPKRSATT